MENTNSQSDTIADLDDGNYTINTGSLFHNESRFHRKRLTADWKKCPEELANELEETLQEVLLKLSVPDIVPSEENRALLLMRFEAFIKASTNDGSFACDYFVVGYDRPIEEIEHRGVSFAGDKFFYLYSYKKYLTVHRGMVDPEEYEILTAFAVRQCDLMNISDFLNFHLHQEWNSDLKSFCSYFKQLTRKYGEHLFTGELTESVNEWINQNESKVEKPSNKKIKTVLTVHQLAYLFRALADRKLIGHNNKSQLIKWVAENFESKARTEISPGSLDSKFHEPDIEVLEFWADQFNKLSKFAASDAQKLSG